MTGLTGVLAIAAGNDFTCAVNAAGASCWGYDGDGELGDGGGADRELAKAVPGLGFTPTMIAAGDQHACAATTTVAKCWGAGASGQLGNGATPTTSTAVAVTGAGGTWTPARLVAGGDHTCALDTGGRVRCWGDNGVGAIGDGSSTDRAAPVQLAALGTTVTGLTAGTNHNCAETTLGLKCWGDNFVGQIGDGTATRRRTPVAATQASGTAPAGGGAHTCAIAAGAITCWGGNDFGQLGGGTFSSRREPTEVKFP